MTEPLDDHEDPAPSRGGRGWGWVVPAAVGLGALLAAASALLAAFDADCAPLPREDLSLAEMGQLRRRVDRYKSDPSTPLTLTAREGSFLLREEFDLPVWLTVAHDELALEARVPQLGRCWNVSYVGDLVIRDGVATIRPRTLSLGHLSLTGLVSGATWDVYPGQMPLPRAAELLQHTTSAVLLSDGLQVRVDDPAWLR